jgi:hypothetical protein
VWVPPQRNVWDDSKEGNYWSDYVTRYPNATEIDGSGIWDTTYVISENNQDSYPLMSPVAIPEFPYEENPPTVPPTEPPQSQKPSFLGTGLPMETGYAILAVIVTTAAAAFLVYFRKIKKTHRKVEKTMHILSRSIFCSGGQYTLTIFLAMHRSFYGITQSIISKCFIVCDKSTADSKNRRG